MRFTGKYKIVTGITTEYKINSQNPKYFAKFVNDNLRCLGNTETEAIENLKNTFKDYESRNKLCSPLSDKVFNSYVPTEKFEKNFGISIEFFELIGEDPHLQLDEEFTVKELELNAEQICTINLKYNLNIQHEDILVDIFEQINKSRA